MPTTKYKKIIIVNLRSEQIRFLPMFELFLAEAMETQRLAEEIKIFTLIHTDSPYKYLEEWRKADLVIVWDGVGTRTMEVAYSYLGLMNFLKTELSVPVYFGGLWATMHGKDYLAGYKHEYGASPEPDKIFEGFSINNVVQSLLAEKDKKTQGQFLDVSGESNYEKYPLNLSHLATPEVYIEEARNRLQGYQSSFSCPRNCIFCKVNLYRNWGTDFVARDIETVKKDIDALEKYFNFNTLLARDLNWFYDPDRFFEFSDYLKGKGIKTSVNVDIVINDITEDIFRKIKEGKVVDGLYFGLESLNPENRKKVGKPFTKEQLEYAFDLADKYRINLHGNIMLGQPWHTPEEMEFEIKTALYYMRHYKHVFIGVNALKPEVGSSMQTKYFPDIHANLTLKEVMDSYNEVSEATKEKFYGDKLNFINIDKLILAFALITACGIFPYSRPAPLIRGKILVAFRNWLMNQVTPPYFSSPITRLLLRRPVSKFILEIIIPTFKIRLEDITPALVGEFFRRAFVWKKSSWYEKSSFRSGYSPIRNIGTP